MNPRLIFIFPATVPEIENIYRSQYSENHKNEKGAGTVLCWLLNKSLEIMRYPRLAIIGIEPNPMEMATPAIATKLSRLAETMALMATPAMNRKCLWVQIKIHRKSQQSGNAIVLSIMIAIYLRPKL